jgi:hypothetical protein
MRIGWVLLGLVLAILSTARAGAANCPAGMAACNPTEQWVFQEIRAERDADPRSHCAETGPPCDPLGPRFLRALIVQEIGGQSGRVRGVRVRNAFICEAVSPSAVCDGIVFRGPKEDLAAGPRTAVRFVPLDLRDLKISGALDLSGSLLQGDLRLGGARFDLGLNLDETRILGDVDAHRLDVGAGLTMYDSVVAGSMEADGLRADGPVNLFQSWIFGKLHMRGARIRGDLDIGRLWMLARDVDNPRILPGERQRNTVGTPRKLLDLSNATIGGNLLVTGAEVPRRGAVDRAMTGTGPRASAGANKTAEATPDRERAAKVSDVGVTTTVATPKYDSDTSMGADLSGVDVAGSLWIENGSRFTSGLSLERVHIGDSLMLGQGTFSSIDLSAARIEREMRLESDGKPTAWEAEPAEPGKTRISLRNARIGIIRDTTVSWPDCVTLAGFVYERPPQNLAHDKIAELNGDHYRLCRDVDGYASESGTDTAAWLSTIWTRLDPDWFICDQAWLSRWVDCTKRTTQEQNQDRSVTWWMNWLHRDAHLTGQTFSQLATALRNSGGEDAADAVLFARRIWKAGSMRLFHAGMLSLISGAIPRWLRHRHVRVDRRCLGPVRGAAREPVPVPPA